MTRFCVLVLVVLLFNAGIGCKSGSTVSGKYGLQQEGAGFGLGAEKTTLDLRQDGTFEITLGNLKLASGTWKEESGLVTLSGGGHNLGTTYKIGDNRLIPIVNNREVTFWRFVKK